MVRTALRFGTWRGEHLRREFERAFEQLGEFPGVGHRRHDLTLDPGLRFWAVGPSLVAYRWESRPIEVVLVERAESDWARLLRQVEDDGPQPA